MFKTTKRVKPDIRRRVFWFGFIQSTNEFEIYLGALRLQKLEAAAATNPNISFHKSPIRNYGFFHDLESMKVKVIVRNTGGSDFQAIRKNILGLRY